MSARRSLAIALCAALLAPAAAPALAEEEVEVRILFVQSAGGFAADPAAGTLRLVDVSAQTVYFSDRPNRLAGHIPMDAYLLEWTRGPHSFGEDPPNAKLSIYAGEAAGNTLVVVELTDPVIDGDDLLYGYTLLDGEMPAAGGPTAVFIDTVGPGGGVGPAFHGAGVGRRGPGAAGWAGVAVRDCADGSC